jgi:hypothetical protein
MQYQSASAARISFVGCETYEVRGDCDRGWIITFPRIIVIRYEVRAFSGLWVIGNLVRDGWKRIGVHW